MTKIELERRYLLLNSTKCYTGKVHGKKLYDEVLRKGQIVTQGYIRNEAIQDRVIHEVHLLNYKLDFKPEVFRLRTITDALKHFQPHTQYILTIKNDVKPEQSEFEINVSQLFFNNYWKHTFGKRIHKKRLTIPHPSIPDVKVEVDGFLDRHLLIAEVECSSMEDYLNMKFSGLDISDSKMYSNKNLAT